MARQIATISEHNHEPNKLELGIPLLLPGPIAGLFRLDEPAVSKLRCSRKAAAPFWNGFRGTNLLLSPRIDHSLDCLGAALLGSTIVTRLIDIDVLLHGGEIVDTVSAGVATTDLTTQATRIRAAKPTAIFVATSFTGLGGGILRKLDQVGVDVPAYSLVAIVS